HRAGITACALGTAGDRLAHRLEVCLERCGHRSGCDDDREKAARATASMRKPAIFLSGTPARCPDPVWRDTLVLQLQADNARQVEPDILAIDLEVAGFPSEAALE